MKIARNFRTKLVSKLFREHQNFLGGCGKNRGGPGPGFAEFECSSLDGCAIHGWTFTGQARRHGTLIYLHGIGSSCVALDAAKRIKDICLDHPGLSACAVDLRCHGRSGDYLPTLGIAETWDVSAVIQCLKENDFPRPFIVMGDSMGGMVATASAMFLSDVTASISIMPPASPLVGIQEVPRLVRSQIIPAINAFYRQDSYRMLIGPDASENILLHGDLTYHECKPSHQPHLLYVMGDHDPFDYLKTKMVWDHIYSGQSALFDVNRSDAPDQNKWFRVAQGYGHDLSQWPELAGIVHDFLSRELHG
jgi:hypothetical protein